MMGKISKKTENSDLVLCRCCLHQQFGVMFDTYGKAKRISQLSRTVCFKCSLVYSRFTGGFAQRADVGEQTGDVAAAGIQYARSVRIRMAGNLTNHRKKTALTIESTLKRGCSCVNTAVGVCFWELWQFFPLVVILVNIRSRKNRFQAGRFVVPLEAGLEKLMAKVDLLCQNYRSANNDLSNRHAETSAKMSWFECFALSCCCLVSCFVFCFNVAVLFQALIDEDRLLSRLEVLENQLQAYSKVRQLVFISFVRFVAETKQPQKQTEISQIWVA